MANYGGNVVAAMTSGRLIYVDESTAVQTGLTEFERVALESVPIILAERGVDGTYQPGILNRAIEAIPIYVEDDAMINGVVRHRSPKLHITVPNVESNGITTEEFGPNQTVSIPPKKGKAARSFPIGRIVKHDGVWVTFELN